ncbi:MAG: DUF4344 domain-containing metallopeptidase [Mycobacterium sp.]
MGGSGRIVSVSAAALYLSLMLSLAGCGHDSEQSKSAPTPSTVTVTSRITAQPSAEPDPTAGWNGKMIANYEPATSADAIRGRDLMRDDHLLEDLADAINSSLKLPQDIPLIGKQCDEANAYWDSGDDTMTICYEDAADALDIYTDAGDQDPAESAINSEVATFYHETGHMAIHLYNLPITGREEDVADQLAAYVLLNPGTDGKIDPENIQAVKDFAREFENYGDRSGPIDDTDLADTHSPNKTRMYNLECWVYGADPDASADLITSGALPEDRADGCADEYQQLSDAWSELLSPYFK